MMILINKLQQLNNYYFCFVIFMFGDFNRIWLLISNHVLFNSLIKKLKCLIL